jgi:hypothetical protein
MAISRFFMTTVAATFLLQAAAFVNVPTATVQSLKTFGLAQSAVAADSLYKPPIRPRPSSRTNGTGSRGCNTNGKPPELTLLVPDDHDGQTVAARPTFFWYLENASAAKFTLVEPGVPTPLIEKTVEASKPGIMSFTMAADAPELAIDKDYRWTVSVLCNPNRSSEVITFTQSFVRRVTPSDELAQELAGAKTDADRARIYAKNGKWYDALAAYEKAVAQDPSLRNEMLSVLDEVKLNGVTNQERKNTQAVNTP